MNNTWTVDPTNGWKEHNQEWLLEANLPGTERCPMSISEKQCELKAGHTCSHAITLNVLKDVTDNLSHG